MEKQSQKISLVMNKLRKLEESTAQSKKYLLNKEIPLAINILKQLILSNQSLYYYQFKGEGNIQSWRFHYPKGPQEWLQKILVDKEIELNQFDLLNISYMIQLHSKTITAEDCLNQYHQLQKKLGERPQFFLGMGNVLYQNEEYLKAQKNYSKVLKVMPSLEKGLEWMCWVQSMFGKKKQVLQYAAKCLKINPQNVNALFLRASWIESQGFDNYQQLLKLKGKYPSFYRICIELGRLCQQQQASINHLQEALQFEPQSAQITVQLGLKMLQISNKTENEKLKQQEEDENKKEDLDADYEEEYESSEEDNEEEDDSKEEDSKEKDDDEEEEKNEDSEYQYENNEEEYVDLDSDENQNEVAEKNSKKRVERIIFKQQKHFQAKKYVYQALKLNQNCSSVYYLLAKIYFSQKEYELAAKNCHKGLQISPNNLNLLEILANIYSLHDYQTAIKIYENIIQLNPYSSKVYNNIGLLYNNLKDTNQAEKYYQKAIELNPNYYSGNYNLALLYYKNKNCLAALQFFARSNQIDPNQSANLFYISSCYYQLSRYQEANKLIQKYFSGNQKKNYLDFQLMGLIQNKLQNYYEALKWLLKSQNLLKVIDSKFIMQTMISKLDPSLAKGIVKAVSQTIQKTQQNVFALMQLGQILLSVSLPKQSHRIFEIVASIHKKSFVSDEIKKALENFIKTK